MAPSTHRPWRDVLGAPLRDRDFRALVAFLATWTFAVNLSTPFFTVYLLRRLGLPMSAVLAFTVLSQATSAVVLRAWGAVADRFQPLAVLRVSSVGFLLSVAGWPVAGLLQQPWLVIAALGAIHVLGPASPRRGSTCAPAPWRWRSHREVKRPVISPPTPSTSSLGAGRRLALRPLDLHGLDFLFVATVLVGLYAVHRILAVVEREPIDRRVVVAALADEVWERMSHPLRAITTVPGVRDVVYFPFSLVGRLLPERRRRPRTGGPA